MLGIRLKELRKQRNITQSELASALNVAKTTIAAYEQEVNEPSSSMLGRLADYFNVTTDYLIGRTEGKTSDLQALYEEIGLSENSISFLKSLAELKNAYPPDVSYVSALNPLPCIDFCLSQGNISFELFDSIYSYFLVNISEDNKIYISENGDVSLKVLPDDEYFHLYQTIPSSYLRNAILQEVSSKLKELLKIYEDNGFKF